MLKYLTKSFSVGMRVALGTYEKTPVWQPTNENLQQYIDGLSQDSSQAELAKLLAV